MVVCGVVVAYAPRCASLSPNGLACEATGTVARTKGFMGALFHPSQRATPTIKIILGAPSIGPSTPTERKKFFKKSMADLI